VHWRPWDRQNYRLLSRLTDDLLRCANHKRTSKEAMLQALGVYYRTVRTRIHGYSHKREEEWRMEGQLQRFHGRRDKVRDRGARICLGGW
jgi:hypothetical protein